MRSSKLLFNEIVGRITSIYPIDEAKSIVQLLFEQFIGFSKTDILLDKLIVQNYNFEPIIARLLAHEPVQYIIGNSYFYGNKFIVSNQTTLIPRPETEELVQLSIAKLKSQQKNNEYLTALDIGTGTGCIAISIAKELDYVAFTAWDISQEALKIAEINAKLNDVKIGFEHVDVLNYKADITPNYDLIVSNPPYVTMAEKAEMHKNVLDFEPEQALFVSNENPLIFYKKIAEISQLILKPNGFLLFEINEQFGVETADCLIKIGFKNVEIHKDINNKNRMISAQK
jgi:release factor glutamine methyltransferase